MLYFESVELGDQLHRWYRIVLQKNYSHFPFRVEPAKC